MNADESMCPAKQCPVSARCRRSPDSGRVSAEYQWWAAYHEAPLVGGVCSGFIQIEEMADA